MHANPTQSFIRSAADIKSIREVLGEDGAHIQVIAKIENRQGLNNFKEILAATDGVMVARGDLGIEIPAAEVFAAQKKLIALCNMAGKPVICATQMLESMIKNPRPTRAEISDVGNAVTDGADCVMLSGETAKGNYPELAVQEMAATCLMAENSIPYINLFEEMMSLAIRPVSVAESCATAAVRSSIDINAGGIVVLSTSGNSAVGSPLTRGVLCLDQVLTGLNSASFPSTALSAPSSWSLATHLRRVIAICIAACTPSCSPKRSRTSTRLTGRRTSTAASSGVSPTRSSSAC